MIKVISEYTPIQHIKHTRIGTLNYNKIYLCLCKLSVYFRGLRVKIIINS